MLSRTQACRWSGQSISNGRQRLATGRNFSSLRATSSPLRSKSPKLPRTSRLLSQQQTRQISLFGWGSSSKSDTEFKDLHVAESRPTPAPEPSYLESARSIKASNTTSDNADISLLQGAPGDHEPEMLKNLEQAIAGPPQVPPEDLASIPERIGYLKEVCGIDFGYGTTSLFQIAVEYLHMYSGLTWSACFLVSVAVGRALMFRTSVRGQNMGAKMKQLQPILDPLRAEYKAAVANNDMVKMQTAANQIKAVTRDSGVSMFASFKPLLYQIPFNFAGYRLGHAMGALPVPALESESLLWLSDMTMTDLWILPTFSAALTLFTLRYNIYVMGPAQAGTMSASIQKFAVWILPVGSFFFLRWQPGIVQVFFAAQSIATSIQVYSLSLRSVRKLLGMAPLARHVSTSSPTAATSPPSISSFSKTSTPTSSTPTSPPTEIAGMKLRPAPPPPPTPSTNKHTSPQTQSQQVSKIDQVLDNTKKSLSGVSSMWTSAKSYGAGENEKRRKDEIKQKKEKYEFQRRRDAEIERKWRNENRKGKDMGKDMGKEKERGR